MSADQTHVRIDTSERAPMPGAVRGDPVPPDEPVRVSVLVRRRAPMPERAGADHMSHDELAAAHGADPADLETVARVLGGFGLTAVESDPARRTVVMEGPASAAAQAFQVELARYSYDGGGYRGREGFVHVPAELAGIVEGVFGLDDRPQAQPHFRVAEAAAGARARGAPLWASQVAAAYSFPNATGAGQTIGLIELGGGYLDTDNAQYFSEIHMTPPTVVSVGVDGAANTPGPDASPGADLEVGLDIQVAGAIAPGARIVVYFAPNSDSGFLDALSTAIHDTANSPSAISISWGQSEDLFTAQARQAFDQVLQDAAAMGVSVCVASGDNGAADAPAGQRDGRAHVDFPAASPFALACGGTHLEIGPGAPAESVWNRAGGASGGGISDTFAPPGYQSSMSMPASANPGAAPGRGVPDVSGNADPATGYRTLIHGQNMTIGGTSAVAPLWAGLIARMDELLGRRVGLMQPALYGGPPAGAFTDIRRGNNSVGNDHGGYRARPGWDPCTGWGTPVGTELLRGLGGQV